MKITVDVPVIIKEVETAITDYEKEYAKLIALFYEKLQKYTTYIKKEIEDSTQQALQHPPYPPSWLRDNFIKTLDALKAHKGVVVEMDDSEYSDIKDGIERMRHNVLASTTALNSLSY